jgi:hypothetical protein
MKAEEEDIDLFAELTEEEAQAKEARAQQLKNRVLKSLDHLSKDPCQRSLAQNRLVFRHSFSSRLRPFSIESLLSPTECQDIVNKISHQDTEWLTSRHSAFSTTDIAVSSVPELAITLPALLADRLLSSHIAPHFGFHPTRDLAFRDLFVVQYAHDAQRGLQMHTDGCLISFNILLNPHTEFEGGGTLFEGIEDPVQIKQGDCLVHDAHVKHGGMDISRGKRLILVGFVDTVDTIKKDNIGRSM